MQESFCARCAPIALARKMMLARDRKLVANIAKKTQFPGRAKQNEKTRSPKKQKKKNKTKKIKKKTGEK